MVSASYELSNTIEKMMKDELAVCSNGGSSNQPSICRVSETLRKLKESAYTPRIVPIGPLHRGDDHLKGMQKHKVSYMRSLFRRTIQFNETFEDDFSVLVENGVRKTMCVCADAMLEVAPSARTYYAEKFGEEYTDKELAKTLLLDGCFILELLFKSKHKETIESNDPVFKNIIMIENIRRDLLLLENQIPFFVLQRLFQLTLQNPTTKSQQLTLEQYVLEFFRHMMIFGKKMTENGTTETCHDHILGFLHNYYRFGSTPGDYSAVKYSATQLHRTGVKFKASEGKDYVRVRFQTSCFMFSWLGRCSTRQESTSEEEGEARNRGISTWNLFSWFGRCNTRRESTSVEEGTSNRRISTPTSSIWNLFSRLSTLLPKSPASNWWLFPLCGSACLELPPISVQDFTELFLRNLIAYEQCFLTVPHYVTSYAFLMDTLINSKDDVELLEDERVLQNYLGASEDASDLFNNLCKEIFLTEFYFSDEWNKLNEYCGLWWPKHLASLQVMGDHITYRCLNSFWSHSSTDSVLH